MGQDSQVKHFDHVDGSHAPLNTDSQVLTGELINDVTDLQDTPPSSPSQTGHQWPTPAQER